MKQIIFFIFILIQCKSTKYENLRSGKNVSSTASYPNEPIRVEASVLAEKNSSVEINFKKDIGLVDLEQISGILFQPQQILSNKVLIYFHGYKGLSPFVQAYLRDIAEKGYIVFAISHFKYMPVDDNDGIALSNALDLKRKTYFSRQVQLVMNYFNALDSRLEFAIIGADEGGKRAIYVASLLDKKLVFAVNIMGDSFSLRDDWSAIHIPIYSIYVENDPRTSLKRIAEQEGYFLKNGISNLSFQVFQGVNPSFWDVNSDAFDVIVYQRLLNQLSVFINKK